MHNSELPPLSLQNSAGRKRLTTVQTVIQEARASIHNPSRPFTPREKERKLFTESEYTVRPTSAYSLNSSNFDARLTPILKKPLSVGSRRLLNIIDNAKEFNNQIFLEAVEDNSFSVPLKLDNEVSVWERIKTFLQKMRETTNVEIIEKYADKIFILLDQFAIEESKFHNTACVDSNMNYDDSLLENRKEIIIHSIGKIMDYTDSKLLMKLSSIILKICEDDVIILNTVKLLFKISKKESNDQMFKEEGIITFLVDLVKKYCEKEIDISDKILIYTVGIMKNISYNTEVQKEFSSSDIILVLKSIVKNKKSILEKNLDCSNIDSHAQSLVQISATLRNITSCPHAINQFNDHAFLHDLIFLVKRLMNHSEFILNTCRLLSKISLDTNCIDNIFITKKNDEESSISIMMNLLSIYKGHKPIVIRICFILGNLFYKYNCYKLKKEDVSLLLHLLESYNREHSGQIHMDKKILTENEDLLLKLIRLIANISTNAEYATQILESKETLNLLYLLEKTELNYHEELILNIVRCINNLSFFVNDPIKQVYYPLFVDRIRIARNIFPLLIHDNVDSLYESLRGLSNLSLDHNVRVWICQNKAVELMVVLLEHPQIEIVQAACGVLLNLTSDCSISQDKQLSVVPILQSLNATKKLIDILEYADIDLLETVLKTIHNLILFGKEQLFSKEQLSELTNIVPEFIKQLKEERKDNCFALGQVAISLFNAL